MGVFSHIKLCLYHLTTYSEADQILCADRYDLVVGSQASVDSYVTLLTHNPSNRPIYLNYTSSVGYYKTAGGVGDWFDLWPWMIAKGYASDKEKLWLHHYYSKNWRDYGEYGDKTEVKGTDGNNYICILDHTSSDSNKPVTGANWETYWTQSWIALSPATWATGQSYYAKAYLSDWKFRNDNNSEYPYFYWKFFGSTKTVEIYSDTGRTQLIASGSRVGAGVITLSEENGSGLTGEVTVVATTPIDVNGSVWYQHDLGRRLTTMFDGTGVTGIIPGSTTAEPKNRMAHFMWPPFTGNYPGPVYDYLKHWVDVSLSRDGAGTVTATKSNHGFQVGWRINVFVAEFSTFNGDNIEILTVPNVNQFTFAQAGSAKVKTASVCTTSQTISSISRDASGLVTVSITNNRKEMGDMVYISNIPSHTSFQGTYLIASSNNDGFTYNQNPGLGVESATEGVATVFGWSCFAGNPMDDYKFEYMIEDVANWLRDQANKVLVDDTTYTCILDHVASSVNEPGVGAQWETYWEISGTGGTSWEIGKPFRVTPNVLNGPFFDDLTGVALADTHHGDAIEYFDDPAFGPPSYTFKQWWSIRRNETLDYLRDAIEEYADPVTVWISSNPGSYAYVAPNFSEDGMYEFYANTKPGILCFETCGCSSYGFPLGANIDVDIGWVKKIWSLMNDYNKKILCSTRTTWSNHPKQTWYQDDPDGQPYVWYTDGYSRGSKMLPQLIYSYDNGTMRTASTRVDSRPGVDAAGKFYFNQANGRLFAWFTNNFNPNNATGNEQIRRFEPFAMFGLCFYYVFWNHASSYFFQYETGALAGGGWTYGTELTSEDYWFEAMAYDIGVPDVGGLTLNSEPGVDIWGETCLTSSKAYKMWQDPVVGSKRIYARKYTKGYAIVRPKGYASYLCGSDELEFPMPFKFKRLRADGSLDDQTDVISLRYGEGAFLVTEGEDIDGGGIGEEGDPLNKYKLSDIMNFYPSHR